MTKASRASAQVAAADQVESHGELPNNLEWGFFGTYRGNVLSEAEAAGRPADRAAALAAADAAWASVHDALVTTYGMTPANARDLLDDRAGRHLADGVRLPAGADHARAAAGIPASWLQSAVRHFAPYDADPMSAEDRAGIRASLAQ